MQQLPSPERLTTTVSDALLNPATIAQLRIDLGDEFQTELLELVELYREQLRSDLLAMRDALAASDNARLTLLAHTLRGASAALGAWGPVQHCHALEYDNPPVAVASALLAALAAEGEAAAEALQRLANAPAP
jgi:HPt (histidine-containing phosphotransfer) domain-containing protein